MLMCNDQAQADVLGEYHERLCGKRRLSYTGVLWCMQCIGATLIVPAILMGTAPATIASLLLVVGLIFTRPALHRFPVFFTLAFMGIWAVLSQYITVRTGVNTEGRMHVESFVYAWLLMYGMMLVYRSESMRTRITYVYFVFIVAVFMVCVLQLCIGYSTSSKPFFISSGGLKWGASGGLRGHTITHGYLMSMLALFFLMGKNIRSSIRWTGFVLAVAMVVACTSRSALFALFVGVFCVGIIMYKRVPWKVWIIGGVLCVSAVGSVVWLRPGAIADSTGGGRTNILWPASVAVMKAHPFSGLGSEDSFSDSLKSFTDIPHTVVYNHAHNSFLCLGTEYGIPTMLAYAAALLSIVCWAWRRRARGMHSAALVIGLISVTCASGMFENIVGNTASNLMCWAMLGLAMAPLMKVSEKETVENVSENDAICDDVTESSPSGSLT